MAGDPAWGICIIKFHRDSRKGATNFYWPDEAEQWRIGPDNVTTLREQIRPTPMDFPA